MSSISLPQIHSSSSVKTYHKGVFCFNAILESFDLLTSVAVRIEKVERQKRLNLLAVH